MSKKKIAGPTLNGQAPLRKSSCTCQAVSNHPRYGGIINMIRMTADRLEVYEDVDDVITGLELAADELRAKRSADQFKRDEFSRLRAKRKTSLRVIDGGAA